MTTLMVQDIAPEFETTGIINKETCSVKLADYMGKYLVLMFYPLDFSPICAAELIAFSGKQKEFDKLNTVVVGVSTDSTYTHLAWLRTPRSEQGLGDIDIPLLSDSSQGICKDYGVLNEHTGYPHSGLFIIDSEQIIKYILFNDKKILRNVDDILRIVKAIQVGEKNIEECRMYGINKNKLGN